MKIGLAQMNTQPDKNANLAKATQMVDTLVKDGASLIVFPEFFNFLGPSSKMPEHAENFSSSASLQSMREKAQEHGVYIHIGSFLEKNGTNNHNTSVVFSPEGKVIQTYRKIHLFDVEIPGGRTYKESDIITPGSEVVTFTIENIVFGMATCYDLRFPEMFRKLMELGTQVILLPAAFTLETGRDHWQLLLRARAVENLSWVVAVNQCGFCPDHHNSYGRSVVIDPWGVVTAQASDGQTTLTADIDMEMLKDIRQRFPALSHIRKDVFPHPT